MWHGFSFLLLLAVSADDQLPTKIREAVEQHQAQLKPELRGYQVYVWLASDKGKVKAETVALAFNLVAPAEKLVKPRQLTPDLLAFDLVELAPRSRELSRLMDNLQALKQRAPRFKDQRELVFPAAWLVRALLSAKDAQGVPGLYYELKKSSKNLSQVSP